jgi:hypothetical protein
MTDLQALFERDIYYVGVIKAALDVINAMQSAGVIGRYAIGGAVAATFYLEPAATIGSRHFRGASGSRSGISRQLETNLRLSASARLSDHR